MIQINQLSCTVMQQVYFLLFAKLRQTVFILGLNVQMNLMILNDYCTIYEKRSRYRLLLLLSIYDCVTTLLKYAACPTSYSSSLLPAP